MATAPSPQHIRRAYLTTPKEGVIELHRDWRATRMPPISLEGKLHGYLSLFPLPASEYARESGYYLDSSDRVVFVFDPKLYTDLDYEEAEIFVAASFNGWQDAIGNEEWKLSPETIGGEQVLALRRSPEIFSCDDGCQFKFVTDSHHWIPVHGDATNVVSDGAGNSNYVFQPKRSGRHRIGFMTKKPIDLSDDSRILYHTRKGVEAHDLDPGAFLFSLSSDKKLGAICEGGRVTFRLFAPRARWVKVGFFKDLQKPEDIQWQLLSKAEDFVWEVSVEENLAGYYYWFRLDGPKGNSGMFDPSFKILDPYAKATVGREGPSIVVPDTRFDKHRPARFKTPQWQDLVILEGHVRDFVAGMEREQGGDRVLGFSDLADYAESPSFYPSSLGVNAIELQPVQENDSQSYGEYHWGYMTSNFFSPHSGYAKEPGAGSQIEEFQRLVEVLHARGFAVILDVVYNHVGEPAHLMFIDKMYYFHLGGNSEPTNWSGCGNDLRTDAPMATRLIVDSLKHLVEAYGVDGFRFDLADLVGKPVLQKIERELKRVRPDVILIAEPWSFRGHIGAELRDTGFASWNDGYREFVKEYVRGNAGLETLRYFLTGSPDHYASWPCQTVNYVESHDDRVWIDDITENGDFDGTIPTATDMARTRLMAALLMMSVGMPMLHAGIDFMGTKGGVRNTYQDGERNALDYRRALGYSSCARYFRDWVSFRRSELGGLLRHYSRASSDYFDFIEAQNERAFACICNASGERGARKLMFAMNPTHEAVEIELGSWGRHAWSQIADHERFMDGSDVLLENRPGETLFLPRLSCGLWKV